MSESPASRIARCLAAIVAAAGRYPVVVLVVAVALAAVSGVAFCTRLTYRTQRSDLMSPDKDYQARWKAFVAEFGEDDDMVVVVEGPDRARRRAAVEALAAAVAPRTDLFERLFFKVDLTGLRSRALLFLTPDQLESIDDNVRRMGPLLNGPISGLAWKNLNLTVLLRQARARAGQFDPSRPLADADTQFLTQLNAVVRAACSTLSDAGSYRNPWSSLLPGAGDNSRMLDEPQFFEPAPESTTLLLVRPTKENGSFTPALVSVRGLREIIDRVRSDFPDLEFGLTGMPVLETDEMEASQDDTSKAGWLALGGVGLLYLVVYRGWRQPLLTVATLLIGTLWAMGWLTATVGHLNILSSCFAVMLIGLGDYGVLWMAHYEDERRQGRTVTEANRATALTVGPGVLTAAVTTALAFFATMLADFQAVAELGWIAGWGVLFCAVATLTVLPAFLTLCDRRGAIGQSLALVTAAGRHVPAVATPPPPVWLPGLARHPRWVLAAGLLVVVASGAAATRVRYDHNLLHMQSAALDSVRWEHRLLERSSGASWCALSHVGTADEARELERRYQALPEVSRVVTAAALIPPDQDRKLPLVRAIGERLNGLPPPATEIEPLPCRPIELRKEIGFLIGALEPQAPVSPQPILEQLLRSLAELRDHAALIGSAAQERLDAFGRRLANDLLADLHRLRSVCEARAITVADLPAALRERFLGRTGRWLVQAYARDGLWDIEPLEHFVRVARTVDPEATGKPFGTLEGLRAMQQGFASAGAYALMVIVAVLAIDFRTVRHTALALGPLAVGSILTLGVMGLFGLPLNPANMIALPLIVGVGVDNGVHVLHDFLASGRRRSYALARTTGLGIAVAALTTVLGFGTLMIGRHRGLISLGFTLALGVTFCMLAALVVLPAALQLYAPRAGVRTSRNTSQEAA